MNKAKHTEEGANGDKSSGRSVAGSRRPFRWPGVVVLGLLAIAAFMFWGGEKTLRYREEVALESGESILVDRLLKVKPLGEIGGPDGWEAAYNRVDLGSAAAAESTPPWESAEGLVPLLLDRDSRTGQWVLVATIYTCDAWRELGRPNLPYAQFRSQNGKWVREALSPELIGRAANMYPGVPRNMEGSLLTVSKKRELTANTKIAPRFLRVVATWSSGC